MKTNLLILFLLLFSVTLAAQEKCALEKPPVLLGLRLQMTPEEAQSVFGKDLKISVKNDGERVIFENFIEKKPPASLSGIRALFLRFIDRRLYQIEIFYEETPTIKTLQDFTAFLSTQLNFPISAWQEKWGKAVVDCGEFTLAAVKTLNPRIELTDEAARAKAKQLREKGK